MRRPESPRDGRSLQAWFRRQRQPGDFVIALLSLLFAVFLAVNLPSQAMWVERTRFFAQPAFWPLVAIAAMVLFSGLHLVGALVSERTPGRLQEVMHWVRALEYPLWFLIYVALVPRLGYLPGTLLFTVALTWRLGYRGRRWTLSAIAVAVAVVLVFKGVLSVKIPAAPWYGHLPEGAMRTFVMTWL